MMNQSKVLFILFFFFFSCAQTAKNGGETGIVADNTGLAAKKLVLPNGLRVIFVENHKLPILSYYTYYEVGGRYESKGITGASHFLEHLMFKGAKKYGPGKFDGIIEAAGGRTNAYTSFDSTVYYNNIPSKLLETVIDLEADRMANLLLEPIGFEKERMVVFEERKVRYENDAKGKLFLTTMKAVFEKTPYGLSVIGSVDDIKNLDRDTVFNYFKKYYAPNNAVIAIVGDIDVEKASRAIREKFGVIPRSDELPKLKEALDRPERFQHQGRFDREIRLHGSPPTPLFMIGYKGVALGTERSRVLDILGMILGDGYSSYFIQKYVKGKKPLLSRIYASHYSLKNNGIFIIGGEFLGKTSLKRFKRVFRRDLSQICKKAINDKTVKRAKKQLLIGYYDSIQTNNGVARLLGSGEHFFNDYNFYRKELKSYEAMTVEQVKSACVDLFENDKSILVSIWKKHQQKRK